MKILFLLNSFGMGGAEKHTIQLARGLSGLGVKSVLCALANTSHYDIPSEPHIAVTYLQGNGLLNLPALRRLSALIGEVRPDIIVGVNRRPLYYAQVGRFLSGINIPVAHIYHSTNFVGWRPRLLEPLDKAMSQKSDMVIYVSRLQMEWWQGRGYVGKHDVFINNGVDSAYYAPYTPQTTAKAKKSLGLTEKDFAIGLVCALRPEKNPLQLVDAVAALKQKGLPAKALFVGDGPLRPQLEARAEELRITDAVILCGSQKDVRPFVAAFDVGVLCSTSVETFSLAALEIMSMGKPVVLSEIGGAAEMVQNGVNGYLFPAGDTAAFIEKLSELALSGRAGLMGEAAKQIVTRNFTLDHMFSQYRNIFDSLLKNHRP